MKNYVSSLEQHYKAFCLVLKIDCALYWLKSDILKETVNRDGKPVVEDEITTNSGKIGCKNTNN